VLNDGSRYRIYKRYLTAAQLADEIGGEVKLDGTWFVAARRSRPEDHDRKITARPRSLAAQDRVDHEVRDATRRPPGT
jgi:hypothetical protein